MFAIYNFKASLELPTSWECHKRCVWGLKEVIIATHHGTYVLMF